MRRMRDRKRDKTTVFTVLWSEEKGSSSWEIIESGDKLSDEMRMNVTNTLLEKVKTYRIRLEKDYGRS